MVSQRLDLVDEEVHLNHTANRLHNYFNSEYDSSSQTHINTTNSIVSSKFNVDYNEALHSRCYPFLYFLFYSSFPRSWLTTGTAFYTHSLANTRIGWSPDSTRMAASLLTPSVTPSVRRRAITVWPPIRLATCLWTPAYKSRHSLYANHYADGHPSASVSRPYLPVSSRLDNTV